MWVKVAAILLAVATLFGGGWYVGHHQASLAYTAQINQIHADDANALAKAEAKARDKEQLAADTLEGIQKQNEKDKADAQSQYEKDLAALRAGTLRLRKSWQCPADLGVSKTSPGSAQPDADANDRAESAARAVRAAADADSQIRALQKIVQEDRQFK